MAQKKVVSRSVDKLQKSKTMVDVPKSRSFFEWMEDFLSKNANILLGIILAFSVLLCGLLFDFKISIGHDDALYLEGSWRYAQNFFGYFYSANAPLYVILMSLPIKLFGLNLGLLKLFSVFFFLAAICITYITFKNRVPYLVLFFGLIIFATNHFYISYASLTYTECFFALVQSIFLNAFFKLIDTINTNGNAINKNWKHWLWMGFWMWVIITTRSVATFSIFAIIVYFIVEKQWKAIPYSVIALAIFWGPWELAKKVLWKGIQTNQYASQGKTLTVVGQNPAGEVETISGYIIRFFENTEIYLSARLWEILGFLPENSPNVRSLTIFTILAILVGLFFAFKNKNKAMFFTILYYGALLSGTFIMLQTFWGQARLVMVYLPFILFTAFYGIYAILEKGALRYIQPIIFLFFFILFVKGMDTTFEKAIKNRPIVSKNLKGDKLAGYTPDYINYFKMSEYCADSLPKESMVAVRKAPMSFIYGKGKDFWAVYSVPTNNADTLLMEWKKGNVSHVILSPIRTDPSYYNPESYVNTVHRYVATIEQTYPGTFQLVKTIGDQEASTLYKINYPVDTTKVE